MGSDHQSEYPQHQQMSSNGLTRYRSAPSSFFMDFVDDSDGYLEAPRPSSPETDGLIARFLSKDSPPPQEEFNEAWKNIDSQEPQTEFMAPPRLMYESSSSQPILPSSKMAGYDSRMVGNSYDKVAPMVEQKVGGPKTSNLVRHSSSPAGLLSHLNVGHGTARGTGGYSSPNGTNGEPSFPPGSRMKGEINFSSGPPSSSSGLMTHISENGSFVSWEAMGAPADSFSSLKRARGDDRKMYPGVNASESQHGEPGKQHAQSSVLSRHASLPNTSSEMASVERYLQFQEDSVVVPCKVRAKRGCATHPRSIAERMRRTRISERMKKLQVLVPNMDEQTSIADMLGLATEYIRDLQKQVQVLSDNRAKCTCSK